MKSLNTLSSIDNNQNIVQDTEAYSLITEIRSCGIAINDNEINKCNGNHYMSWSEEILLGGSC